MSCSNEFVQRSNHVESGHGGPSPGATFQGSFEGAKTLSPRASRNSSGEGTGNGLKGASLNGISGQGIEVHRLRRQILFSPRANSCSFTTSSSRTNPSAARRARPNEYRCWGQCRRGKTEASPRWKPAPPVRSAARKPRCRSSRRRGVRYSAGNVSSRNGKWHRPDFDRKLVDDSQSRRLALLPPAFPIPTESCLPVA